jgi:hypothetical protein
MTNMILAMNSHSAKVMKAHTDIRIGRYTVPAERLASAELMLADARVGTVRRATRCR